MPFAVSRGARLYWKLDGEESAPAVVLLNSIGTDMDLWDACLPELRSSFRVLRMDTRGHGASDAPCADYSLALLAEDVFAVMDAAGLALAAIAGVSLGGMIAMEMALAQPQRVAALALICTSATMDRTAWADRVVNVRAAGMGAIADLSMGRFLSPQFAVDNPGLAAGIRRQLLAMDPAGYAGCAAAIRDMAIIDRLGAIACPSLVITGDRDTSTPFAGHGENLLRAIPGARHLALASAHLAPVEAPRDLAAGLGAILAP